MDGLRRSRGILHRGEKRDENKRNSTRVCQLTLITPQIRSLRGISINQIILVSYRFSGGLLSGK